MPGSGHEDLREYGRSIALHAEITETAEWLVSQFQFDGLHLQAAVNEVLGRFEKVVEAATGPGFDEDGFIPPMQTCTEAEVTRWFGFSDQRQKLLDRIRKWIGLARAVKAKRLLLDGSFVTRKDNPGDVDAVVLLPDDFRQQVRAGSPEAVELYDMLRAREPRELFAAEDEEDWWGWFSFFTRTREANGRCKGLIEVAL